MTCMGWTENAGSSNRSTILLLDITPFLDDDDEWCGYQSWGSDGAPTDWPPFQKNRPNYCNLQVLQLDRFGAAQPCYICLPLLNRLETRPNLPILVLYFAGTKSIAKFPRYLARRPPFPHPRSTHSTCLWVGRDSRVVCTVSTFLVLYIDRNIRRRQETEMK